MSDVIRDVMQAIQKAKSQLPGANSVHLNPDTIDAMREHSLQQGFPVMEGVLGGTAYGLNVIADSSVAPGHAYVVDDRAIKGYRDAGTMSPEEIRNLFGPNPTHITAPPEPPVNPYEDMVQRPNRYFDYVQRHESRVQCKECLSFAVHLECSTTLGGEMTFAANCSDCGMAEIVDKNPMGAGKHTVTRGNTTKGTCARCGVEQRVTMLKRVAHRSRDEVTTMLDLCEGCSQLTLCVASHSGLHEHVIPYDSPNHTAPRGVIGPLPETERGGWCLACHTSMYWVWTVGCTGAWVELTWPLLADMWEREGA